MEKKKDNIEKLPKQQGETSNESLVGDKIAEIREINLEKSQESERLADQLNEMPIKDVESFHESAENLLLELHRPQDLKHLKNFLDTFDKDPFSETKLYKGLKETMESLSESKEEFDGKKFEEYKALMIGLKDRYLEEFQVNRLSDFVNNVDSEIRLEEFFQENLTEDQFELRKDELNKEYIFIEKGVEEGEFKGESMIHLVGIPRKHAESKVSESSINKLNEFVLNSEEGIHFENPLEIEMLMYYGKEKVLGEGVQGKVSSYEGSGLIRKEFTSKDPRSPEDIESVKKLMKNAKRDYHSPVAIEFIRDEDLQESVQEKAKGQLFSKFIEENGGKLSVDDMMKISRKMFEALQYINENNGVIHRDLKPDNIFLEKIEDDEGSVDYEFKIIDWDLAGKINNGEKDSEKPLGSLLYSNVFEGPTPTRDVHSMGVMMYELFTGENPDDFLKDQNQWNAIMMKQDGDFVKELEKKIDEFYGSKDFSSDELEKMKLIKSIMLSSASADSNERNYPSEILNQLEKLDQGVPADEIFFDNMSLMSLPKEIDSIMKLSDQVLNNSEAGQHDYRQMTDQLNRLIDQIPESRKEMRKSLIKKNNELVNASIEIGKNKKIHLDEVMGSDIKVEDYDVEEKISNEDLVKDLENKKLFKEGILNQAKELNRVQNIESPRLKADEMKGIWEWARNIDFEKIQILMNEKIVDSSSRDYKKIEDLKKFVESVNSIERNKPK